MSELTAKNTCLHLEIASLKAQLSSQSFQKTVTPSQCGWTQHPIQPPPVLPHKTHKKTNIATNVPTYSKVAATPKSPAFCLPVAVCHVPTAACGFQIPTGAQGFQYTYIPYSHKMQHKEVHNYLCCLGVDTSCILDISFPAHSVLDLLVHNQFATSIHEILDKFDHMSPEHLADPKFEGCSNSKLANHAHMIHLQRCCHALVPMKYTLVFPVLCLFVSFGWMQPEDYKEFLKQQPVCPHLHNCDHPANGFQRDLDNYKMNHEALSVSSSESPSL